MNKQVIYEINQICGKSQKIKHIGCLFKIGDIHCIYMDYQDPNLLKICIPFLAKTERMDLLQTINIINQVNREVKYVKSFLMENGTVSLVYERKIFDGEKPNSVVPHMIKVLEFASEYIKRKLLLTKTF